MLMEVQIQSLRVRKYGTDLLIEGRVLRGSLAPEQRRDQYRNCCNLQSTQAADGKHGGLLLDWIEYHPVSEARHFQGNLCIIRLDRHDRGSSPQITTAGIPTTNDG